MKTYGHRSKTRVDGYSRSRWSSFVEVKWEHGWRKSVAREQTTGNTGGHFASRTRPPPSLEEARDSSSLPKEESLVNFAARKSRAPVPCKRAIAVAFTDRSDSVLAISIVTRATMTQGGEGSSTFKTASKCSRNPEPWTDLPDLLSAFLSRVTEQPDSIFGGTVSVCLCRR